MCRLPAEGLTHPQTCNGKRSARQGQRQMGGEGLRSVGGATAAPSRSPRNRHRGHDTPNRRAARANRERIGQPSPRGRARPDAGRLCTRRSGGPGPGSNYRSDRPGDVAIAGRRGSEAWPQAVPRLARPAISLRSNSGIFWARSPGLPNAAGALEPFNSAAVDNTEAKLD